MSGAANDLVAGPLPPGPERTEELIRRHAAGGSARVIARALGLTPGQVNGQLFRPRQQGRLAPRAALPRRSPGLAASPEAEARRREVLRERALARRSKQRPAPAPVAAPAAPAPEPIAAVTAPAPIAAAPLAPVAVAPPAAVAPLLWPEQVGPGWITEEWPRDKVCRLWNLWVAGTPGSEIARRLGVSKNAVVGKAHRIGLDSRPSPIQRAEGAVPPAPPRARPCGGRPTLPPLASAPLTTPWAAPPAAAPPFGRVIECCWPIGDPGTRSFRFCDGESMPGKPYCAEHAQIAFQKVRDRGEYAGAGAELP